jgi:hypothetical protein
MAMASRSASVATVGWAYNRAGAEAAAVLDEHFTRPDAEPADLEYAFHGIYIPVHWNEHVAATAWRAGEQRVQETGRWLVTHSRDRRSATIGLALLAAGASVLNRADWTAIAEGRLKEGDDYSEWVAHASRGVPLTAFTDLPDDT